MTLKLQAKVEKVASTKIVGAVLLTCWSAQLVGAQPSDVPPDSTSPSGSHVAVTPKPEDMSASLVATVQSTNGQMEVQRPGAGEATTLSQRSDLFYNDVLSTSADSKGTLLFKEGSRLDINSSSMVELTPPQQVGGGRRTFYRVIRGETLLHARSPLAVTTPSATAAVRGTVFDLNVDGRGSTVLTVFEGVVDFFNGYGKVAVRAGQQSTASFGQAPTAPIGAPAMVLVTGWTRQLDNAMLLPQPPVSASIKPIDIKKKPGFIKKYGPTVLVAVGLGLLIHSSHGHNSFERGTTIPPD